MKAVYNKSVNEAYEIVKMNELYFQIPTSTSPR
jgi:hypothetical protein